MFRFPDYEPQEPGSGVRIEGNKYLVLLRGNRVVQDLPQLLLRLRCGREVQRGKDILPLYRIGRQVECVDIQEGLEVPGREDDIRGFPHTQAALVPQAEYQQEGYGAVY